MVPLWHSNSRKQKSWIFFFGDSNGESQQSNLRHCLGTWTFSLFFSPFKVSKQRRPIIKQALRAPSVVDMFSLITITPDCIGRNWQDLLSHCHLRLRWFVGTVHFSRCLEAVFHVERWKIKPVHVEAANSAKIAQIHMIMFIMITYIFKYVNILQSSGCVKPTPCDMRYFWGRARKELQH